MRFRPYLCLVALLTVCFASNAKADAQIEDFFGSYTGFGFATDRSGPFIRTERDFEFAIGPLEGGGFEIAWATVKRKGSDPNSLVSEVSEHRAPLSKAIGRASKPCAARAPDGSSNWISTLINQLKRRPIEVKGRF